MTKERVQKLLARAGYGSRRSCEKFIRAGRVRVNGKPIALGARADPNRDTITIDGEQVHLRRSFRYVVLNKPRGVVSTVNPQPQDQRPTVRELVDLPGHLVPVGRLDVESEGLMLLTDDGELVNRLTHPRYEHTKTYRVLVRRKPDEETLDTWRRGVVLPDGYKTLPCEVKLINVHKGSTWLEIVMREGRKRQIREVGRALGHPVLKIIRTHIGPLALGDLKPGAWRKLASHEVRKLQAIKRE